MQIEGAQFVSKSSAAGVVYVELGFVPDFVLFINGQDQAIADLYLWARGGTGKTFPQWAAEAVIKMTGSTGALSRVTTANGTINEYAGGDTVAVAETDNTDGKHVTRQGVCAAAGHVTAPGIRIAAALQPVASVFNLVLALRVSAL